MSFNFDGHAINILGSTNGSFIANIDGKDYPGSGTQTSQPIQASLFGVNTLDQFKLHTITITNLDENAILYIDAINWPAVQADKNGTLSRVTEDDVEPAFHFQGVWSTSSADSQNFFKGTGHTTTTKEASFDLTFTSCSEYIETVDAISLFGSTGPDHGPYSVQLDDQPSQIFQAKQITPAVQVMIYYISHLEPGPHTLHVVNQDDAVFAVDFVTFATIVNVTTS
ncbi:hypothetical protein C0995_009434, partial [Termitomyces sp. Mi166